MTAYNINEKMGTIFDIRRFSTHDGSGIRTTVFFKGCPLSCVWCHNPEGISVQRRLLYFEKKCIGCRSCCINSVQGGMAWSEEKGLLISRERKEDWDLLIDGCPTGALCWDSRQMTADQVLEEVLKDVPFYRHGGGVTLSGGEPLLQSDFAAEVLKALKKEGIHTAIETALEVDQRQLEKVLPWLDCIYADLKVFDEEKHRLYVGTSGKRIRENIKFLLTSSSRDKVIIRTPMIPEFTAAEENVAAISRFLSGIYKETHYELLNYNPLAEAKYHLVDKEYCFKKNPSRYSKAQMEGFGAAAAENGLRNILIDE